MVIQGKLYVQMFLQLLSDIKFTVVMVCAGGRGAFLWGGESGSRGMWV